VFSINCWQTPTFGLVCLHDYCESEFSVEKGAQTFDRYAHMWVLYAANQEVATQLEVRVCNSLYSGILASRHTIQLLHICLTNPKAL
jgi:hypothetical protein